MKFDNMKFDKMTREQTEVVTIIKAHRGVQEAISRKELVRWVGLTDRAVREIIHSLICDYSCPIGSQVKPPYGYFWISSQEELIQVRKTLRSYMISIAQRLRAVDQTAFAQGLARQQKFAWGQESESNQKKG